MVARAAARHRLAPHSGVYCARYVGIRPLFVCELVMIASGMPRFSLFVPGSSAGARSSRSCLIGIGVGCPTRQVHSRGRTVRVGQEPPWAREQLGNCDDSSAAHARGKPRGLYGTSRRVRR